MASTIYANGREISCKAGDGKSICAFPDTCFTPPENPATPPGVPVPYPNTGSDPDATEGTRTVSIREKEVMLKNVSYFDSSVGDEAGAAAKKGLITTANRGKVYFAAWSMDVKFEGNNVTRHLDITTHNHASQPANALTQVHIARAALGQAGYVCKNRTEDLAQPCQGKSQALHSSLKCNAVICNACIDRGHPGCEILANAAQAEYESGQQPPPQNAFAQEMQRQRGIFGAPGSRGEATGASFSMDAVTAVFTQGETVVGDFATGSYKAHCTVCHGQVEIDIVTNGNPGYMLEVKVSAKSLKLRQIKKQYESVRKSCPGFASKKIGIVTDGDAANIKDAQGILRQWKREGVDVDLFAVARDGFSIIKV